VGIDLVVLGFAPVDGLHVQRMPEDEGDPLLCAEIGEPVPREDAFYGHHQVLAIRRDGGEEVLRSGRAIMMDANLTVRVQHADVHPPRVQVNPTIVSVLLGVESHPHLLLPPGGRVFAWPHSPYPVGW
jgi:hypothetical protein